MPKYSVFNLASACVLVPGDIQVADSTRRRNAAMTLPTMVSTRAFCSAGK